MWMLILNVVYVLVAIANHPNAAAARPALDALIDWTARDGP